MWSWSYHPERPDFAYRVLWSVGARLCYCSGCAVVDQKEGAPVLDIETRSIVNLREIQEMIVHYCGSVQDFKYKESCFTPNPRIWSDFRSNIEISLFCYATRGDDDVLTSLDYLFNRVHCLLQLRHIHNKHELGISLGNVNRHGTRFLWRLPSINNCLSIHSLVYYIAGDVWFTTKKELTDGRTPPHNLLICITKYARTPTKQRQSFNLDFNWFCSNNVMEWMFVVFGWLGEEGKR